ncbi:hypothetical protein PM082_012599 [Marasmius tenuissimus]|nr:hypothetical protein PM082_012599 [Marasmius tenuissimus]
MSDTKPPKALTRRERFMNNRQWLRVAAIPTYSIPPAACDTSSTKKATEDSLKRATEDIATASQAHNIVVKP